MKFQVPFHRVHHADDADLLIIGAGVLPFFVCDTRGVCFLLGKERFVADWNGSLCWSGFEGGNKGSETPECNAAREYLEETMGSVDHSQTTGGVEQSLGEYALRIAFRVGPRGRIRRVHVTYVKEIAWDTCALERFDATRAYLLLVDAASRCLDAATCELDGLSHGPARACAVHLALGVGAAGVHARVAPRATAVRAAQLACRDARRRLGAELRAAPGHCTNHPAVDVKLNTDGEVQRADVNSDFWEKSCMRVWTLAELREVCDLNFKTCRCSRSYCRHPSDIFISGSGKVNLRRVQRYIRL